MPQLTNNEALNAVLAWVEDVIPAIEGTYDYVPTGKEQKLPDVVCDLASEAVVRDDPDFPWGQLQQASLRVFRVALSFMVDAGESDSDAATAQHQLRAFAQTLVTEIVRDATLGGRVFIASPYIEIDYTPPFVEYADGTRGREMTANLATAELIEVNA